jgi:hypothetical protein
MWAIHEKDDGKFIKVANVVGHAMQYHPHGDASIADALVNLTNKRYLIEGQGNFGNIFTGDPAAASRYIECRLTELARNEVFNDEITEFVPSYDGRNKEPVVLPCKLPLLLMLGTEGIAVGMSSRILPHNFFELIEAQIAILENKPFKVLPDFFTGGLMDSLTFATERPSGQSSVVMPTLIGPSSNSLRANTENRFTRAHGECRGPHARGSAQPAWTRQTSKEKAHPGNGVSRSEVAEQRQALRARKCLLCGLEPKQLLRESAQRLRVIEIADRRQGLRELQLEPLAKRGLIVQCSHARADVGARTDHVRRGLIDIE